MSITYLLAVLLFLFFCNLVHIIKTAVLHQHILFIQVFENAYACDQWLGYFSFQKDLQLL